MKKLKLTRVVLGCDIISKIVVKDKAQ